MAKVSAKDIAGAQWVIPESSLYVLGGEENVLGRGAYGEVRKGVWRGTTVACKRLHFLTGVHEISERDLQAVKAAFLKEMAVLTSLRHPNLLQFLGVTFDERTRSPEWIVTEMMDGSLYSLLHEQRVNFTLTEIIDLAIDVARGLWVCLPPYVMYVVE